MPAPIPTPPAKGVADDIRRASVHVCQDFSHSDAFWRRVFASAALWVGKDGKGACFEWTLIDSGLEEAVRKRGVKRV